MPIGADFGIDTVNRRVYHQYGTTVYDVNELYSWLQDVFDELAQMDNPEPMSAQTPTAYTMINGWFLDPGELSYAHKYLSGGAIKTDGYSVSGYDDGVRLLKLEAGGYVWAGSGDLGEEIGYSGGSPTDTGTLLSYDNTKRYWWIRVDNGDASDEFTDVGTALDVTDGAGSGAGNLIDAGGSLSGEELYTNVYTLGTISSDPSPQAYIFQGGIVLDEWSNLDNWNRGHIDVLLKIKEAGYELGEPKGYVTVFARQESDSFDHFEIDLGEGGRNAVPLGTATDLDHTTADYYLLYDGGVGTDFSTGEIISETNGTWSAEVISFVEYSSGVGLLGISGVKGTLSDDESFSGGTSGATGITNGTLGDTLLSWDAEASDFSTLGQIITGLTSGAKRLLRGVDGANDKAVCQVDETVTGTAREAYYTTFDDDENATGATDGDVTLDADSITAVSGFSDITVAFVNGTVTTGGTSGTFTVGEQVTWDDGQAQTAIVLKDSSSVLTLGNCTSTDLSGNEVSGQLSSATATPDQALQSSHTMLKAFEQQSDKSYDVIIQGGDIYEAGRTLAQVYQYLKFVCREDSDFAMYTVIDGVITELDGEEYIQAFTGYTPVKSAPFGTFAGGKFFGAQSVWVSGMASGQSYQLIDAAGATQTPPISVTVTVSSLITGDRVGVFLTAAGAINKAQYQSHNTNNTSGLSTFEVVENIAQDTPAAGILRVINNCR